MDRCFLQKEFNIEELLYFNKTFHSKKRIDRAFKNKYFIYFFSVILILAFVVKFQAIEFKHLYFCDLLADQISLVLFHELLFSIQSFYYNI